MTAPDFRLARLMRAAALHRDVRLSAVAATSGALADSIARHDSLDPPPCISDDTAVQAADFRHRHWAEGRRRALLPQIIQLQSTLHIQRKEAALAIARCQVLDRLSTETRDQPS